MLLLNYNNTRALDTSNNLTVNTVGFLTPTIGYLGLMSNASGLSYVVSKYISTYDMYEFFKCSRQYNINSSLDVIGNIHSEYGYLILIINILICIKKIMPQNNYTNANKVERANGVLGPRCHAARVCKRRQQG